MHVLLVGQHHQGGGVAGVAKIRRRVHKFGESDEVRGRWREFGLIGVLFLFSLAHMVYPTTFVLYADYRFHWGTQMVGITLALVGVTTFIEFTVIGVIITVWAVALWIKDTRREIDELPLEAPTDG